MKIRLLTLAAVATMAGASYGSIVDFETTGVGGGTPTDGMAAGQTFADGNTEFEFFFMDVGTTTDGTIDGTTGAYRGQFEHRGEADSGNGFQSTTGGGNDVERTGFTGVGLDDFFLTPASDYADNVIASMVINYTAFNPTQASGQIWDINARANGDNEAWVVTAYDVFGNAIV